jgi:Kef-type K+ transport system membrane component KefB
MRRKRTVWIYLSLISGFTLVILWIISRGRLLEKGITHVTNDNQWQLLQNSFLHNFGHPLAILLIQIVIIILVARLFSWICRKIDQPEVIGEIAAGIVLGPSLLGLYFPSVQAAIFPPDSLGNLQFLSQIGLILFMFVIGMELDLNVIKNQAKEAVVISHASILVPFTLGVGLAYYLYPMFAPAKIPFLSFGLFMGISMSITAFPVLARIVQERGIHKTTLGAVVITCAAVDDISAWSLLAIVIALVKAGSLLTALPTLVFAVIYVYLMFKMVKPFLKRVGDIYTSRDTLDKAVVAIFFIVLILSAYTTEILGIHALFGAFMAGVIMPENRKFKQLFIEKVEDVALVLLLPLFFVYTGLRTQVGLLNDASLWISCGLIIVVAITGKFAGSAVAARIVGQSWKDSLTIGALMNTRGLVELVALNIGYDLGIITPGIFTMLVIMALFTTFMTAPALNLIDKVFKKPAPIALPGDVQVPKNRILISFGNPEMGRTLLRMANSLIRKETRLQITVLHFFSGNLFSQMRVEDIEKRSFEPVMEEAGTAGITVETIFRVSEDIEDDIASEANQGYDLLLIGIGHSIFEGSALGNMLRHTTHALDPRWIYTRLVNRKKLSWEYHLDDRTGAILSGTKIPVGVFINRGLSALKTVLIVLQSDEDIFLKEYADRMISVESVRSGILDVRTKQNISSEKLRNPDLLIISLEGWKNVKIPKSSGIENDPSVLIIRP